MKNVCENLDFDHFYCRQPDWTKSIFPDNKNFYQAALRYYYLASATKFLAKYRSGFLLKDILDRFSAKVAKTLSPDLKYTAYSTHDINVANLLNSLGVFDVSEIQSHFCYSIIQTNIFLV